MSIECTEAVGLERSGGQRRVHRELLNLGRAKQLFAGCLGRMSQEAPSWYLFDGHAYATDRIWGVRVPVGGLPEAGIADDHIGQTLAKKIESAFLSKSPSGFDLSATDFGLPERCVQCAGTGRVTRIPCSGCYGDGEFYHDGHYYHCKSCDGEGSRVYPTMNVDTQHERCANCNGLGVSLRDVQYLEFGGKRFSKSRIQLLSTIDQIQFFPSLQASEAVFTCPLKEGGRAEGILMGMLNP